jgi:hypothetical protein
MSYSIWEKQAFKKEFAMAILRTKPGQIQAMEEWLSSLN